ncbi:MAG: isoprenylcysteine carboxylmethyltransferase family protein [Proteobacteria bacterium]|nr:isoprenylcysteine carboxylmethyltransferase family protein [Desulfobulbaceae bacterium]MBU4152974.1 isoprenylcysteine carboxylmethyltransferase family protein [Pseudomonadota bacterium]
MNETVPAYGLWPLVIINSAIFILFAYSFIKPKTKLDWRSLGAFSAFIVALFAEMYGFPLTIYFLSGWLQANFPQSDILAHGSGHLWYTIFGFKGDPHTNPIHLLSNVLIFAGFYLTYRAWIVLHAAQQAGELAITGPYSLVRHPQYDGFILVMVGFLVMWPTLLTLAMFPVLVIVYVRLAKQEEKLVRQEFGSVYDDYAKKVPSFLPSWKK